MANAQRKTWIHGFFTNTFNAETGNWQLRDSRNEGSDRDCLRLYYNR